MAAGPFRDPRPADGGGHRALHDGFVQVIPGRWPEPRVSADSRRGKHKLPAPFGGGVGVFPFERRGKRHTAETF
jgi:hypothetical protein